MEVDPTRVCELLIGLGEVTVLGAVDEPGGPIRVHVQARTPRPSCPGCAGPVWVKDRRPVELVDLPAFGRPARLVWSKRRWSCPSRSCAVGSFTEVAPWIAAPRLVMTDRAGRWVTEQVGRYGRPVVDLVRELGCDWHTINDTVLAYGTPLVEDPNRIGTVEALGLDEVLFARQGRWRTQAWSTQFVDVGTGRLLDVIPGRTAAGACAWLQDRDPAWRNVIRFVTLDLSGPWRLTFDTMLPDATQVADPCSTSSSTPTPSSTSAAAGSRTRPSATGVTKTTRSTVAGACSPGPMNASTTGAGRSCSGSWMPVTPGARSAWPDTDAKETVRSLYDHTDPDLAVAMVDRLGHDLQDQSCPPEINQLGRTLIRWADQITAWHEAHVSNGPTEAANNLIKRIKRIAFGFRRFRNYRIRALLYAGRPNWDLLTTTAPTPP